jgi:SAM-dependent methyltransferase
MQAQHEAGTLNMDVAPQAMTTCSLCGAAATARAAYPCADEPNALAITDIDTCAPCGIAWAVPRPDQAALDRFYDDGEYWHGGVGDNPFLLAHQRVQARVRLGVVAPRVHNLPQVRILDVGAGNALIADELPAFFSKGQVSYTFVEPDPGRRADVLERRLPFPVRSVDSLAADSGSYEVIFLNHVLEHVANPVLLLRTLGDLLSERGILYVEVPNLDNQYKCDVFPHVQFFSSKSLRTVLERAGLECLAVTAFGRPAERGVQRRRLWNLRNALAGRAFSVAVRLRQAWLAELANRWMYAYSPRVDGLWVRGIFQRRA